MLPEWSSSKVLVVGDVMLDRYWHGHTNRISPEAPVPIVHMQTEDERPGGAGNVALNINRLGGFAQLLAKVGTDAAATCLQDSLAEHEVPAILMADENFVTPIKLRIISQNQQLLRIDFEDPAAKLDQQPLLEKYKSLLPKAKGVILSDYAKGTLLDPQPFISDARAAGVPVFVDPKGKNIDSYRGVHTITPNRKEFENIVGVCATEEILLERGEQLVLQHDFQAVLVTRGHEGMTLIEKGQPPVNLPTRAREIVDVTGAGDTVIAVLVAAVSAGSSLLDATRLANLAAGLVVKKLGTSAVTAAELQQAVVSVGWDS